MRPQIQYDWYVYKKRKSGHLEIHHGGVTVQRKDPVRHSKKAPSACPGDRSQETPTRDTLTLDFHPPEL